MQIRKAGGEELLKLWGYDDVEKASPTARFFCQNISSGNAVFLTVDNQGELIGELYAFMDIEEDRNFANGKDTAYLCAFRIRKDYRGQGLGTRLMETVISDLRNKGFIYATIGADDSEHVKMYQHMRFSEIVKICYTDPCARDENKIILVSDGKIASTNHLLHKIGQLKDDSRVSVIINRIDTKHNETEFDDVNIIRSKFDKDRIIELPVDKHLLNETKEMAVKHNKKIDRELNKYFVNAVPDIKKKRK